MARNGNGKSKRPLTAQENVNVSIDGDLVTISFDASQDCGPSVSGKTNIVASTRGNLTLANGVTIGFNAYRSARRKV